MLNVALHRFAILVTIFIQVINRVFTADDWLGIEQGLAVITFRGTRLKFKGDSVCLARHILLNYVYYLMGTADFTFEGILSPLALTLSKRENRTRN